MRINDAINVLKDSQAGHLYDVWVPSLKKDISFRPLTVGQLKSLNKFSLDNEDNFYKALSALIVELSDKQIDLKEINELDRVIILSEIKKNNTTTSETLDVTCSGCEKPFTHLLNIENYENNDDLDDKVKDFNIEVDVSEDTKIKCVIGLPTIAEQISYKDYIVQMKRKKQNFETKRVKTMFNLNDTQKNDIIEKAVDTEEKYLAGNLNFLFIRNIAINDTEIDSVTTESVENRISLYDQLPGSIRGEITNKIVFQYKETLDKVLRYTVRCPHCEETHTEEVPISNFFII
jgi:hypothetical protein